MRGVVDEMARIPPGIPSVLAPFTAWGLWLRNMKFAVICWSRMLEFTQRWSSARAFTSNEGDGVLPEYGFGEDE